MTCFRFIFVFTFWHRNDFFVLTKISYLQHRFSAKKLTTGRKNNIFGIFFVFTSSHQDETFLFLSKLHIYNGSEKSWGDKIALQTNKKTNEQTNTTGDHITRQANDAFTKQFTRKQKVKKTKDRFSVTQLRVY